MRRLAIRKLLAAALALAAVCLGWLLLAPPQLGGSTSYVIVYGSSMEPGFSKGDLVLLRRAADYEVGDVAAYESPDLGRTVMHRIVERKADRYVFKGDNNDFLDFPEARQVPVTGKLWFRVPAAGRAMGWLQVPSHAALVAGLLALFVAGGGGAQKARGRRGRRQAAGEPMTRRVSSFALDRETAQLAAMVCGAIAAASAILALWAFSQPTIRTASASGLYEHRGTFAYSADASRGPVYPSGSVATGETVFTRLVDDVDFRFDYRLHAATPRAVAGTSKLVARIEGDNGWRRTVVLQPQRRFAGDAVTVRGTLELEPLLALGRRVEALTGTISQSYGVSLVPTIRLGGTVDGEPLQSSFAPVLLFRFDSSTLRLDTASPSSEETTALERAKGISASRREPARLGLVVASIDVSTARWVGLIGALLALAGAACATFLLGRDRDDDEPAQIAARYGAWLIHVAPRHRPREAVREVTTIDDLARLAERYDRMILHEERDHVHSYLVEDDGLVYRYQVRDWGSTAALWKAEAVEGNARAGAGVREALRP
jgi:signal peptidase I